MTRAAIVIPNFNGRQLLGNCLDGVLSQDRPADEVVVVDDGSQDGSADFVRDRYPAVRVIELGANRGFPAAVNAGIAGTRSESIALLNNDAVPDRGWLGALVRTAASAPEYAAFASRLVTFDEPPRIDSAGIALTHGFGQLSVGDGALDGPAFAENREVLGPCAGAALYRRALFDAIGAFDERLVMYWEDYDVALRAQVAGFRSLYVGAARVRHRGSATIGRHSARAVYHYLRNRRVVIRRSVPPGLLARERPAALWTTLKLLILFAGRGRALAAVRGILAGYGMAALAAPAATGHPQPTDARARLAALLAEGSRLRREALACRRRVS